jgi:hypothetical protein
MRSVMVLLVTHYCAGNKIEKNEMDGACSAYGKGREVTGFWWGNIRERETGETQVYMGG